MWSIQGSSDYKNGLQLPQHCKFCTVLGHNSISFASPQFLSIFYSAVGRCRRTKKRHRLEKESLVWVLFYFFVPPTPLLICFIGPSQIQQWFFISMWAKNINCIAIFKLGSVKIQSFVLTSFVRLLFSFLSNHFRHFFFFFSLSITCR